MIEKTLGECSIDEQFLSDVVDISSDQVLFGEKRFAKGITLEDSNYIQKSRKVDGSMGRVYNYSYSNSFIQCEEAYSGTDISKTYGIGCTGYRGFCILGMTSADNTVKLSGNPAQEMVVESGDKVVISDMVLWTATNPRCDCWSYVYEDKDVSPEYGLSVIGIVASDTSSFTLRCTSKSAIPYLMEVSSETEAINHWNVGDENAFYFVPAPSYNTIERDMLKSPSEGGIGTAVIGNQVVKSFRANHVEGGSSKAIGKYAHAEGRACVAEGRYSHAQGSYCHSRKIYSYAGGQSSIANGSMAYAFGKAAKANYECSQALGWQAVADHRESYVWSGISAKSNVEFKSHANGSYNVYPEQGISGFYIGNQNFVECVLSAVQSMDDDQKSQFKSALGL